MCLNDAVFGWIGRVKNHKQNLLLCESGKYKYCSKYAAPRTVWDRYKTIEHTTWCSFNYIIYDGNMIFTCSKRNRMEFAVSSWTRWRYRLWSSLFGFKVGPNFIDFLFSSQTHTHTVHFAYARRVAVHLVSRDESVLRLVSAFGSGEWAVDGFIGKVWKQISCGGGTARQLWMCVERLYHDDDDDWLYWPNDSIIFNGVSTPLKMIISFGGKNCGDDVWNWSIELV